MSDNLARGLSGLMREAQESLEADGVEAAAEVATAARSRRRRSGALLGAVAVVTCVALGATGVGVLQGGERDTDSAFIASPSPVPSEDLSVPLASATIPIHGGPQYDPDWPPVDCGAPAPNPTGRVEDFGVSIAQLSPLTIPPDTLTTSEGATVDTLTTYDSRQTLQVEQDPVTLLLVSDGKVAGRFSPRGTQPYWTYTNSETFYGVASLSPYGEFCPEVSTPISRNNDAGLLNPGEYQVIPVAHLWASEESAALKNLYEHGITVGEMSKLQRPAGFLPGSWDCQQSVEYGLVPRACLGDVTGTAIVNEDAGTVTLPYSPTQLTRAFDVTVVGDPVALSVTEPFDVPDGYDYTAKTLDAVDPIECGTTFDYTTPEPAIMMGGQVPHMLGTGKGAFNSFNVSILPVEQGSGVLDLEYGAKAWLVAGVNEDEAYFEGTPGYQEIVGVADASIAGGHTVVYDRFAGPTTVDLVLTNVELCEGVDAERGLDSAILDGNIATTPTGKPPAEHTHTLLQILSYYGF